MAYSFVPIALLVCAVFPLSGAAKTVASTLRLDSQGYVDQISPRTDGFYFLKGEVDVAFGEASGSAIPVTISVGGLRLAVMSGPRMPALTLRLAEPATGTLTREGADKGALTIEADVIAEDLSSGKQIAYSLTISTETTPIVDRGVSYYGQRVDSGTRYVQMITSQRVEDPEITEAGNFFAVVSGHFDKLPAGAAGELEPRHLDLQLRPARELEAARE